MNSQLKSGRRKGEKMKKEKLLIEGPRVQEVGYPLYLMNEAARLGLPYFDARNLEKTKVEVLVGGNDGKVEEFIKFAQHNFPEGAVVNNVSIEEYKGDIKTTDSFIHTFSATQLYKFANTGVKMLGNQDKMLEKQDQMLEKQDQTINELKGAKNEIVNELRGTKNEIVNGLSGAISGAKDEIVNELRGTRDDIDRYMEGRFNKIENDISSIKAHIGMS